MPRHHPLQRGSSLFEALIACLVLAVGLIGLARLQGQQRADADSARQRGLAVRLAQDDLERLRIQRPFATVASTSRSVSEDVSYRIDRSITPLASPQAASATVVVTWTDRRGSAQRVELHTILGDALPALEGALLAAVPR